MEPAGFFKVMLLTYTNLFNFNGYQDRRSFMYFLIGFSFQALIVLALVYLEAKVTAWINNHTLAIVTTLLLGVLLLAFAFTTIISTFGSFVRRLHDMGYSGILFLLVVIVSSLFVFLGYKSLTLISIGIFISGAFTLFLIFAPSQVEDNKYRSKNPFLVRPKFVEEVFSFEE
ncbi:DUF805 domain-containing protein [Psittacicella gerlachiana]|nr:DUF805 domain-containing protein [Psittacicella gerlachiana]